MGYQYDTSQFASSGYPQVVNYAALPSALVYAGQIFLVLNSSGLWPFTYHSSGFYLSNGTTWTKIDNLDEVLNNSTLTDINGWVIGDGSKIQTATYTPAISSDVSKTFSYNFDGTLNVITDSRGTKTMVWNSGVLTGIIGTGIYPSKAFTYVGGVLTGVTVS